MSLNKVTHLLGICIPTYNRGQLLNKLLNQLYNLNDEIKSRIQICMSDNCSTDDTSSVIDKWSRKLSINSVRQETNIGGSRNFQAVASLSTAQWVLLMGDDDLLSEKGLEKTLDLLTTLNINTWVLADILNQDDTTLLNRFSDGKCSKYEFKKRVILDTLDPLGFMSSHVIPKVSIQKFVSLGVEEIYGWPHLALLFLELNSVNVYVQRECIVRRGGDEADPTQTWKANDWLCIMMQKTKLCCFVEKVTTFSNLLALREYCRWAYIRQTLFVRSLLYKKDVLFYQAKNYINSTKINFIVKFILKMYVYLLLLFPVNFINFLRKLYNSKAIDVCELETVNISTDGIERGL